MRFRRKEIPQINSGSMADIAFLLLIFFLMISSIESNTGIYRYLSPGFSEEILKKKTEIENRNILQLYINAENQLLLDGEIVPIQEVKNIAKTFITNPENSDYLPSKEMIDIQGLGNYPVATQHVIQLIINPASNYQTYISVTKELTVAYSELREELSLVFFKKNIQKLNEDEKAAIWEAYPFRVSETIREEVSDE